MKSPHKFLFIILGFILSCSSSDSEENIVEPEIIKTINISITAETGTSLDFGNVVSNHSKIKKLTITNSGNSTLSITSVNLPSGFSSNWSSKDINAGNSEEMIIEFNPTEINDYSNTISLDTNATYGSSSINCIGFGVSNIYKGLIELSTQEEIDEFGKAGYIEIDGGLCLGRCFPTSGSTDVINLLPLSGIQNVNTLNINNTSLESLENLSNLNVKSAITIFSNESLQSLKGFPETSEECIINFNSNPNLSDIDELLNITSCGTLYIKNCDNIETLNAISNLKTIHGDLEIIGNNKITNLDGLQNLDIIHGGLRISGNENLYSYCGMIHLLENNRIEGIFYTMTYNRYNPTSEIITECSKEVPANTYYGSLKFRSQRGINIFSERNYEIMDGSFWILSDIESDLVKDISKLNTLKEITGEIHIRNTELASLNGLDNLQKAGNQINITDNHLLTNFCSLSKILQNPVNYTGTFHTANNLYNPTKEDMQNGTCSQ